MAQTTQGVARVAPVRLSLGYKVVWGVAGLGTSLISGTYGALLPIFYQDYLGLQARWMVGYTRSQAHTPSVDGGEAGEGHSNSSWESLGVGLENPFRLFDLPLRTSWALCLHQPRPQAVHSVLGAVRSATLGSTPSCGIHPKVAERSGAGPGLRRKMLSHAKWGAT
jgi:hypothetical protein